MQHLIARSTAILLTLSLAGCMSPTAAGPDEMCAELAATFESCGHNANTDACLADPEAAERFVGASCEELAALSSSADSGAAAFFNGAETCDNDGCCWTGPRVAGGPTRLVWNHSTDQCRVERAYNVVGSAACPAVPHELDDYFVNYRRTGGTMWAGGVMGPFDGVALDWTVSTQNVTRFWQPGSPVQGSVGGAEFNERVEVAADNGSSHPWVLFTFLIANGTDPEPHIDYLTGRNCP